MRFWVIFLTLIGLLWSSVGLANVVITGTRIVYPAQNKEIGIELTNAGDTPALVQAWISDANNDRTKATPFVLMPPVFRMEGNKKQTLRVIHTQDKSLAQDKETLFYFNLLDIPPMLKAEEMKGQNYLQFSLLSNLKFFYRPANLKPTIDKAYQHLTVQKNATGLTIANPTPYYMTISNVALLTHKDDTALLGETSKTPMIAPFEKADIEMVVPSGAKFAKVELINDYGGRFGVPLPILVGK